VWADEKTIDLICDYLRASNVPLRRGLCHGSRNGAEVRWFKERLGIDVIGTDISETASDFGLVQWDFHEANPEWVGQFDFIYTNSHDHAYDPRKAFNAWVDQLAPQGKLIIEHTTGHAAEAVTELDPFGLDARLLPYVVLNFSEGKYAVVRILKPQHAKQNAKKGSLPIWVFIIARL